MTKIAWSGSGYISQRHGAADSDPGLPPKRNGSVTLVCLVWDLIIFTSISPFTEFALHLYRYYWIREKIHLCFMQDGTPPGRRRCCPTPVCGRSWRPSSIMSAGPPSYSSRTPSPRWMELQVNTFLLFDTGTISTVVCILKAPGYWPTPPPRHTNVTFGLIIFVNQTGRIPKFVLIPHFFVSLSHMCA